MFSSLLNKGKIIGFALLMFAFMFVGPANLQASDISDATQMRQK